VIISYPSPQKFGGGIVTTSGANTIHTFQTSGTLSPLSSLTANFLVIAGGGGAGGAGGGGGAGGYRTSAGTSGGGASAESTLTIDTNSIYLVTVGGGGAPGATTGVQGTNGTDSAFLNITSIGGGYGSGNTAPTAAIGGTGGSGGASHRSAANGGVAGAGTAGQGFAGGLGGDGVSVYTSGGGGGGAAQVGATTNNTTGAAGGNGVASSITGTSVTRAGGGGGGTNSTGALGGSGGSGGGGKGSDANTYNATAGEANTGGGGGGAQGNVNGTAQAGGSGIVIISYAGATQLMAGGTVTISGGNVIHTFNSSGYLAPIKLVGNSLRFRSSASAYLSRTPATAGNRRTYTWSGWIKRGILNSSGSLSIMGSGTNVNAGNGVTEILWDNDSLRTWQYLSGTVWIIQSSAVYRDPAAWYHVVIAVDTTQATASNRVKMYINGVEITSLSSSTYPSQNYDTGFNSTDAHNIYRRPDSSNQNDGYATEINFIDGQALTPNSFGTANSYGVWQPITYGGSYGTNGFYLPMTASSASLSASYLVVAGGGAGGQSRAGGGGGGGLLAASTTLSAGSSYTVTVGAGSAGGAGTTGGTSSLIGGGLSVSTTGGGSGGQPGAYNGVNGGSGGGGPASGFGGTGIAGQGFDGAAGSGSAGGGGGGAGQIGTAGSSTGGAGGNGIQSSITGTATYYAGGGGGGLNGAGSGGVGGLGGGATGGAGAVAATSPTPNTGGGGGGGGGVSGSFVGVGSAGASGVVIVSYAGTQKFAGGNISNSGGNTIHTFTASGTLTPIGLDFSPQGNNWTGNNISTTSGSTYDIMTDVPTLTSTTAANYCVMNPLTTGSFTTLSGANLNTFGNTVSNNGNSRSSFAMQTGKWYIEATLTAANVSTYPQFGIMTSVDGNRPNNGPPQAGYASGLINPTLSVIYMADGTKQTNNSASAYGASFTNGDVIGIAIDSDNGAIYFSKNGTFQNSGVPTSGGSKTGAALTWTGGTVEHVFSVAEYNGSASATNFGQQPFTYTAPSGFLPLNTFNL
jgi:hypothetical protein